MSRVNDNLRLHFSSFEAMKLPYGAASSARCGLNWLRLRKQFDLTLGDAVSTRVCTTNRIELHENDDELKAIL